ncbi:hypothetical protein ACVBEH_02295 [Roseateles sp. GG27B]
MPQKLSLHALNRVFASLDALRNGQAFYALLSSFCLAGLMLASAESALSRSDTPWGVIWAALGLICAFLGVNTTGLLLMDQARGRPVRDVADAFSSALRSAPKILLCLLMLLVAVALALAVLLGLLWLVRLPWVGAPLFVLLVPVGVVFLGVTAFSGLVLVGPLTGPSVWAGNSAPKTARMLLRQLRHGALEAAALMAAVFLVTGLSRRSALWSSPAGGRWPF